MKHGLSCVIYFIKHTFFLIKFWFTWSVPSHPFRLNKFQRHQMFTVKVHSQNLLESSVSKTSKYIGDSICVTVPILSLVDGVPLGNGDFQTSSSWKLPSFHQTLLFVSYFGICLWNSLHEEWKSQRSFACIGTADGGSHWGMLCLEVECQTRRNSVNCKQRWKGKKNTDINDE